MYQENRYYEHSGKIGLIGPIYMILFGAVSALVLGAIYGYAIFYIPFIYLNFFITLGFGGLVGFMVGMGGKSGKVRNTKALLLFGFVSGLFAEYVGWISWIFAISKQKGFVLFPSGILYVIRSVSESGAWSIFGWTPTGIAIYIIWGIEAILIIGASTLTALSVLSSTPFCENCDKWIEEKVSVSPLEPADNPDELKNQLEQGDYSRLQSLKKQDVQTAAYTETDLLHCPGCRQNHFLTIRSVAVSKDSDNKEKKDENNIVENLIITPERYKILKEHWQISG